MSWGAKIALFVLLYVLIAGNVLVCPLGDGAGSRPARQKPSSEVANLIKQGREAKKTYEESIGKLLFELTPGMTREEVEDWLGGPFKLLPNTSGGSYDYYAIYYCTPPGTKGQQFMTVQYKKSDKSLVFVNVKGPHRPGPAIVRFPPIPFPI
jgi:hypothetical protein